MLKAKAMQSRCKTVLEYVIEYDQLTQPGEYFFEASAETSDGLIESLSAMKIILFHKKKVTTGCID